MPRRNVWFNNATDASLTDFAGRLGVGRGEAVRVLLDIAGGNHVQLRAAARQHLADGRAAVGRLRSTLADRRHVVDLDHLAGALAGLAALLARPGPGSPVPSPPAPHPRPPASSCRPIDAGNDSPVGTPGQRP